MAYMF
jgi:hypothetical protein